MCLFKYTFRLHYKVLVKRTIMKTEIKILHSSCCAKQSPIKERIKKVAASKGIEFVIEELSDMKDTMVYGTTSFPSLVINGKVYDYRKYQTDAALSNILN